MSKDPNLPIDKSAVKRFKTKDFEVETHDPDKIVKAQVACQNVPTTFCQLNKCIMVPDRCCQETKLHDCCGMSSCCCVKH